MFNPDLPVTKLPVFRAVLIIGGILTVGTTVAIGYHTNLSLCFTATCFNNLLEFFKVPIRLLAATLSIIGLIALAHRSEQSAKQIKLSESQNNFSNYYKHREEFENHIHKINSKKSFPGREEYFTGDPTEAHYIIFPNAKHGDYTPESLINYQDLKNIKSFLTSLLNDCEIRLREEDYTNNYKGCVSLALTNKEVANYFNDNTSISHNKMNRERGKEMKILNPNIDIHNRKHIYLVNYITSELMDLTSSYTEITSLEKCRITSAHIKINNKLNEVYDIKTPKPLAKSDEEREIERGKKQLETTVNKAKTLIDFIENIAPY
ncbi:hypothetical protein [Salinivibrio kushneri]|uniref:hypothetical protein n=1 Tax=Salinivibrio kushneri TaxID=1908198 RepID=UPI0009853D71|nr:hypothetical protein [Salinivibrio kushneri]OOE61081.1 hypothetical protein BZG18_10130 [Salinivibrio kushneri]